MSRDLSGVFGHLIEVVARLCLPGKKVALHLYP